MAKKATTKRKPRTVKTVEGTNGTTTGEPNKSAAVRAYLEAHPGAKGKEVVEALAAQGITIKPNFISVVKSNDKKKAGGKPKGKRGRKPGAARVASTNGAASNGDLFSLACEFIHAAGGLDSAIQKLQMLKG